MTREPEILVRVDGRAGRLTMNRPHALNALSHAMCRTIENALDDWRNDGSVDLVIIDAGDPRAFCAGGDITAVYHAARAGDFSLGQAFWYDEYRMNAKLAEYPKPVVSFMNGYVMGGGVGLGGHVSHRIVGESTKLAMPECGIGLVPDVGGTWILAQAPGRIGEYLGITGRRIGAADALFAGFADHFVPEAEWPALIEALCQSGTTDAVPQDIQPDTAGVLQGWRKSIERCFWGEDMTAINAKLETASDEFAIETRKSIARNSVISMEATLRLVRMARNARSVRDALRQEYRFTYRACQEAEFLEGVRAQLIDKDRDPKWQFTPDTLPARLVEEILRPLPPERDLVFD
ncbi:enoyl-CoA hydratase/isomerase family protein [Rhodobacteraceae bacterium]|nr:enoyl-CoA hydratase/isomerase family protein [Paracoccaceae bacterium]